MAFNPAGSSPERANDPSRGAFDPVTMEIMHKYGMATELKVHLTPEPQPNDNLADFIGKYRLEAPHTEVKPSFVNNQIGIFKPSTDIIDLANTTSLSSSHSGEENSQYLCRVKHDGAFLNSTSFCSSHSNDVLDNPTQMLRKFNLKSSDEGDNSSTSTEKITNHGSRLESPGRAYSYIGSFSNTPNFQAKLRNRLERVATESSAGGASPTRFRPISTFPSVFNVRSQYAEPDESEKHVEVKTSVSSDSETEQVTQQISREETSYLTGFASLHIGAPIEADVNTAFDEENETNSRLIELIEKDAKSEDEQMFAGKVEDYSQLEINENEEQSSLAKSSSTSTEEHSTLSNVSNGSFTKASNGSYDESEFKQMANITHSYQKHSDTKVKPNSKVSAIPMSGIGVDLSNDYNDGPKILTPRETGGGACTMSSFVSNLFGKSSVKKKGSILDLVTMICSPLPDNIPSPTVLVQNFESAQGEEVGYEDASLASPCESETRTRLTLDTYEEIDIASDHDSLESDSSRSESKQSSKPRYGNRRPPSPDESDHSPSEESEDDATTLRDDDDDVTMATMSTLTYSKVNSIYGGGACYHRGPMGGLYASKRLYTPRNNAGRVRGSRYRRTSFNAYDDDDDETQMTMSTYRDDGTQATMSTLTYSKVGSLYGSNAIAGYHRCSKGGYYNRQVDAEGYYDEDDDGWETCSRLTTSTFGAPKPYRPQNHIANRSYKRGGYYDRRFDIRECSQSGSETSTVTSYTATDVGSTARRY